MKTLVYFVAALLIIVTVHSPSFAGSNHQLRQQRQWYLNNEKADFYLRNGIITPEILKKVEQYIPAGSNFSLPWRACSRGFCKMISKWKGEIEARWDGSIYLNGEHVGYWK